MAEYDPYAGQRIQAQREVGLAQAAAHQAGAEAQAQAASTRARLDYAARMANLAEQQYQSRENELGDPGKSYGGGRLDRAAIQKAFPEAGNQKNNLPATIPYTSARGEELEMPSGDLLYEVSPSGRTLRPLDVVGTRDWDQGRTSGFQSDVRLPINSIPAGADIVSQPVHVIRGLGSSYAGGTPGEEWRSLHRAAQAINRAAGQGEYAPPGASTLALQHKYKLEEIAAGGKVMEASGAQARLDQKEAHNYLNNLLLSRYGIPDPLDKTGQTRMLPSFAQDAMLQGLPKIKTLADVEGFLQKIGPELEQGKQRDLFNNPVSRDASRAEILTNYRQQAQAAGRIPDPNTENYIKTTPVTKDNLFWFKQFQGSKTPSGLPPSLKSAATAKPATPEPEPWAPNNPNPWPGLLKKVFSYGQKDWEPMPLPFREDGGPVEKNQPYIVGEKGPEVFVPQQQGTILPDLSDLAPVKETNYDEVALAGKG
jgi:hypothetical protein